MITPFIAGVELVCVIILAVYALADNERIYASVCAAIMGSILSGVLGYHLLFGLIQTDVEEPHIIQDSGLGYFCIMVAIIIFVIALAVVADYRIRQREAREAAGV